MTRPEGTLLQPLFQPQAVIRKKAPCPGEGLLLLSHSVVPSSSRPRGAAESEGCPKKPLHSQGVLEEGHQGSSSHCLQGREPQRVSMSTEPGGQACWPGLVSSWPGDQGGGRGGPLARIRRLDRPSPAALDPARLEVARCSPNCRLPPDQVVRVTERVTRSLAAMCFPEGRGSHQESVCTQLRSADSFKPHQLHLISCTIDEISQQKNLLAT